MESPRTDDGVLDSERSPGRNFTRRLVVPVPQITTTTGPADFEDLTSAEGGRTGTLPSRRLTRHTEEEPQILYRKDVDALSADEYYFTVSGELRNNINFVQKFKTIQELEMELFEICRAYEEQFQGRGVDLQCLRQIFHISQLQSYRGSITNSEKLEVETEVEASLTDSPWALRDYKWIERVFHFLNLLVMKWELIDPNLYRYRNAIVPPTDPMQIHKYKKRQIWVFPIETVWFAIQCSESSLRNQLTPQLVALAKTLEINTLRLISVVASLNFKVNFELHRNIRDFLIVKSDEEMIYHIKAKYGRRKCSEMSLNAMGESVFRTEDLHSVAMAVGQQPYERSKYNKPVKPKITSSELKLRYAKAKEIGFHLLELPSVLCRCMESEMHTTNANLRSQLSEYEKMFRSFEYHFTRLVEKRKEVARERTPSKDQVAASSAISTNSPNSS